MSLNYQTKARKILKDCGAFLEGDHFIYSSGLHGDFYVNKDALYVHPKKVDDMASMMSDITISTFGNNFDVILAPAVSGIIIGNTMAYNLSLLFNREIMFAIADYNKQNPKFRTIRRGYECIVKHKKVLLVDDIVTTGSTLVSMAQSVRAIGGEVIGATVICDRGGVRTLTYSEEGKKETQELQITPLVELDLQTFTKEECPLCKANRPVNTTIGEGCSISYLKELNKKHENTN